VVIIGGAKVESRMKVLDKFLKLADHLLFGGKIANVILSVKGLCVGRQWPDKEIVKKIEKIDLTNPKIHLPIDAIVSPDSSGEIYTRQTAPAMVRPEEEVYDIGEETVEHFSRIISEAELIFWSGPLGLAEQERFRYGTEAVARAIIKNKDAFSVVGGGDTVAILKKLALLDRFSYISVGGGAMLAFLVGEKMPGLESLNH
jgi:phosphoglycerate kinase